MMVRTSGAFGSFRSGHRGPPLLVLLFLTLLACVPGADSAQRPTLHHRVVGLAPSLNELVVAMGAEDLLAARTNYDTHPALVDLPSVGGGLDPSLERLVSLKIDLVLLVEGRDSQALARRLADLGMESIALPTNTVGDLYSTLDRLGVVLNREEAADSLSRSIQNQMKDIQERVEGRPAVDVMYVVGSDPPMTAGPGTFLDDLIQRAGGRNVFQDSALEWPTVGFETIVHRDPQVLVWPLGKPDGETVHRLKVTPGWRDVPAVQEGRVIVVDGNLFNRPGPRLPEAARILAQALHPEAFANSGEKTP